MPSNACSAFALPKISAGVFSYTMRMSAVLKSRFCLSVVATPVSFTLARSDLSVIAMGKGKGAGNTEAMRMAEVVSLEERRSVLC
jgi:hypothetical protein